MLEWWLFMLDMWKPCLSPAVLKKSANIPCSPRFFTGTTHHYILHQSSAELVPSPNTKHFSDIYFCLTFHQLWVIWEKSVKGELSVLFSFATEAFFREMVNSLFALFPVTFCQFLAWNSFNPSKNLLWLDLRWFAGLKCISNERIYQYHDHLAIITSFVPFIPPIDFESQSGI